MYELRFELFNQMLRALGLRVSKWSRGPETVLLAILPMSALKNAGFNMVLNLARVQSIPPHFYEAAEFGGAGRLAKMFTKMFLMA